MSLPAMLSDSLVGEKEFNGSLGDRGAVIVAIRFVVQPYSFKNGGLAIKLSEKRGSPYPTLSHREKCVRKSVKNIV